MEILLLIYLLKTKFHYAIWSQTGSKLVADLQLVLDIGQISARCRSALYDKLRTCLRPDSVMEFGFYGRTPMTEA